MTRGCFRGAVAGVGVVCAACTAVGQYSLVVLGRSPSSAQGVSADGSVVVGRFDDGAFLWNAHGGFVALGPHASSAWAVSADGRVVAGQAGFGGSEQAFRWTDSSGMVPLGLLGGSPDYSNARGISPDGRVVVGRATSPRAAPFGHEAFRWAEPGPIEALGDLPGGEFDSIALGASRDGRVIVGRSSSTLSGAQAEEACFWEGGQIVPLGALPGGFWSGACDASADGLVIVGYSGMSAVRWVNRQVEALGPMDGGTTNKAWAVSADGHVIVGDGRRAGGNVTPFIWDPVSGARDIRRILLDHGVSLQGATLYTALGVSDDGRTVVGVGRDQWDDEVGWVAQLGAPCWADCDHSTGIGVLDIFDFLCFQNRYALNDPYACDCDTGTGQGVCDIFDFLCFQNAFAGGCP